MSDNIVIIGSGSEHRRLDALVEMNHPVVVPMTFPEEPEVWTINDADNVALAALQHWERAPANARWLHNAGLTVALTSSKLRDGEKFYDNLLEAIKKGLPASDALAIGPSAAILPAPARCGRSRSGSDGTREPDSTPIRPEGVLSSDASCPLARATRPPGTRRRRHA